MTMGEAEGVLKLKKPYISLPSYVVSLVKKLEKLGYTLEHKK